MVRIATVSLVHLDFISHDPYIHNRGNLAFRFAAFAVPPSSAPHKHKGQGTRDGLWKFFMTVTVMVTVRRLSSLFWISALLEPTANHEPLLL